MELRSYGVKTIAFVDLKLNIKHKIFHQGICLNSSATEGSDNSLTPLTPEKIFHQGICLNSKATEASDNK